jgi:dihydrofolate reductase
MRKIIASLFVSLDGVMEGPGPNDPYPDAGWTVPYWTEDIGKVKSDELFASDALLLGRITYEGFAEAWPSQKDPMGFADRMNSLPKYVVSTSLQKADWNNSYIIRKDVMKGIARLKDQAGQDILIGGSARLINSLMKESLIDEYRMIVYPVVLGSGKHLFQEGSPTPLKLDEARPLGKGVVLLRYSPGETPAQ